MLVTVLSPTPMGPVTLPAGATIDLPEDVARALEIGGSVELLPARPRDALPLVAKLDAAGNVIGLYRPDGTVQNIGGAVGAPVVDDFDTQSADAALSAGKGYELNRDKAPKADPIFTGDVQVPDLPDNADDTRAAPTSWVKRLFGTVQAILPSGNANQYLRGDKELGDFGVDVRAIQATGLTTANAQAPVETDGLVVVLGKLARRVADAMAGVANRVPVARSGTVGETEVVLDLAGYPLPLDFRIVTEPGTVVRVTSTGGTSTDSYDCEGVVSGAVMPHPSEPAPPTQLRLRRMSGPSVLSFYTLGG